MDVPVVDAPVVNVPAMDLSVADASSVTWARLGVTACSPRAVQPRDTATQM